MLMEPILIKPIRIVSFFDPLIEERKIFELGDRYSG